MTEAGEGLPSYIEEALTAIQQLPPILRPLRTDPTATASQLRDALRDPTRRRAALLLASLLDPIITMLSLDVVIGLAASDRDAVLVRQILGRMPYHETLARVPAIVDVHLDDADDHDYRRYAELLVHLGLGGALRDLCARASKSPEPGIREVADEFG